MNQAVGSRHAAVGAVTIRSHKDLEVWQRSFELAASVYRLTATFPASEFYGLTNQMRRAALSVPANIAEGYRRRGKDYVRFLRTAIGSASELETYLLFSQKMNFGELSFRQSCLDDVEIVLRMLNRLIESLG